MTTTKVIKKLAEGRCSCRVIGESSLCVVFLYYIFVLFLVLLYS